MDHTNIEKCTKNIHKLKLTFELVQKKAQTAEKCNIPFSSPFPSSISRIYSPSLKCATTTPGLSGGFLPVHSHDTREDISGWRMSPGSLLRARAVWGLATSGLPAAFATGSVCRSSTFDVMRPNAPWLRDMLFGTGPHSIVAYVT